MLALVAVLGAACWILEATPGSFLGLLEVWLVQPFCLSLGVFECPLVAIRSGDIAPDVCHYIVMHDALGIGVHNAEEGLRMGIALLCGAARGGGARKC